eukprot:gb/GEZJ01000009.1/.p4 GENE.gb/GEZJ01000009.1/~~gb/GEZJ01000009.1/.p4  ORF type:complete len:113 (-),score=11.74 gb/GEZJ01000009.1/:3494-3832(-)
MLENHFIFTKYTRTDAWMITDNGMERDAISSMHFSSQRVSKCSTIDILDIKKAPELVAPWAQTLPRHIWSLNLVVIMVSRRELLSKTFVKVVYVTQQSGSDNVRQQNAMRQQ